MSYSMQKNMKIPLTGKGAIGSCELVARLDTSTALKQEVTKCSMDYKLACPM